jgi:acyl carrier protein
MTRSDLLSQLEQLVEAAPGSLQGPEELAALPGWDSLTQVTLVLTIERSLGVTLNATQVAGCRTVNDLLQLVAR